MLAYQLPTTEWPLHTCMVFLTGLSHHLPVQRYPAPIIYSMDVKEILGKSELSREEIVILLQSEGEDKNKLFERAIEVKTKEVGNKVYFRGLIEFSNYCAKDCYYCGIR